MIQLKEGKEYKEIEELKKQNEHLSQINDQLVKAKKMLKEYLQEVN